MALILRGKTTCAICQLTLEKDDEIVATSHFITDKSDPLWRYSDAAMHRRCFLSWDARVQFVERFNSSVGRIVWGNGTQHHMLDDGTIVQRRVN